MKAKRDQIGSKDQFQRPLVLIFRLISCDIC